MIKALVVIRTVVLIFLVGYTIWVMPFAIVFSSPQTREVVAVSPDLVKSVARAAWFAIGWIAFETVIGWSKVAWIQRGERKDLKAALKTRSAAPSGPGEPPLAPPR